MFDARNLCRTVGVLVLFCGLLTTPVSAQTLPQILLDMGTANELAVRAEATSQAASEPRYRSRMAGDLRLFTGPFVPDSAYTKLAIFSDDGCTVRIDGNAVHSRSGQGQHLPDLNQSFHVIDFTFVAGQSYDLVVEYTNTIYPGDWDVDGCTLFAFGGGGSSAAVDLQVAGISNDEEESPGFFLEEGESVMASVSLTGEGSGTWTLANTAGVAVAVSDGAGSFSPVSSGYSATVDSLPTVIGIKITGVGASDARLAEMVSASLTTAGGATANDFAKGTVWRFDSLIVRDADDSENYVIASSGNEPTLYVANPATIELDISVIPSELIDDVRSQLQFAVEGQTATPDFGDFSSPPLVALDPLDEPPVFLAQAGRDKDGNGKLEGAEKKAQAKVKVGDVVIEKCPNNFIPRGGTEDNTVTIKAKVLTEGVSGRFEFTLDLTHDVSDEKGFCLNAPLVLPVGKENEDSDLWNDLRLRDQAGFTVETKTVGVVTTMFAKTTATNLTEATVTVSCTDYGAFGKIKAKFYKDGSGTGGVAAKEEGGTATFTRIPLDDNDNHIADSAEQDHSPDGKKAATDDDDDIPTGNGTKGDRLSRYEEYRGFMVAGAHVRTDVTKKDVFWCDVSGNLPVDDWMEAKLGGTPIQRVQTTEVEMVPARMTRFITFNRESHSAGGQRAIWHVENPPVLERSQGLFFGAATIGFNQQNDNCYSYTDNQRYGIRSGADLVDALDATGGTIKLSAGVGSFFPLMGQTGTLQVGDEIVSYGTFSKTTTTTAGGSATTNGVYTFGQLTRGIDAVAHAQGTTVRWFTDNAAVEMTKVNVAHEAGHNVGMAHDTTEDSLMTQVKGGQTVFIHEYRLLGFKKGSLQEFHVK